MHSFASRSFCIIHTHKSVQNGLWNIIIIIEIRSTNFFFSDTELHHITLALSDDQGTYVLSDVCKGRNYTFTSNAPGYIPQTVPGVDGNLDVTLERIGKCI